MPDTISIEEQQPDIPRRDQGLVNFLDGSVGSAASFAEKGYIKLKGLLTERTVRLLKEEALNYLSTAKEAGTDYGKDFSRLTYGLGDKPLLRSICQANAFRKTIVEITGSPVIMADAQAFELTKDKIGFTWHYDSLSFRFIRPNDAGYSLWIPLHEIHPTLYGGGMAYVPENIFSARMNFQLSNLLSPKVVSGESIEAISEPLSRIFDTPGLLSSLLEDNKEEDEFDLGDAFLFRKSVWHRSSPLSPTAPKSRLAVVIRFLDWRSRLDKVMFEGESETGGGVGMGKDWGRPTQAAYGAQFTDIEDGDEIRTSKFCGPIL